MKISTLRLQVVVSLDSLYKKLPKAFGVRVLMMLVLCLGAGEGRSQTYYLNDDFEDNNITGWTESTSTRWAANNSSPISGTYSLRHIFNTASAGNDQISYSLTGLDLSVGTTTWEFRAKHGFLPSASNNWSAFLISNQNATQMTPAGTANGYAVGVNYTGSSDIVCLWRITAGTATPVITSTINWDTDTDLGTTGVGHIQVIRTTSGGWTLKIDKNNDGIYDYTSAEISDVTYTTTSHFGIYFKYSSTGDQLLRIDDVQISQQATITPTKLIITSITPSSPTAGNAFNVTVQAQDASNNPGNVTSNTDISLSTNGNAGAIGGTTTGTIANSTNSVTVTGVILPSTGTGVTITATQTSGTPALTAGTSSTFSVLAPASQLAFVGLPASGNVGTSLASFTVEARRPDNSVDNSYTGNITIAKTTGPGNLTGTLTVAAVAGVATFSTAQFDAVGTYTITASSGALTPITSGNIVITIANTTAILWSSPTGSAWLTAGNWTGGVVPSSTQVAQFGVNPTPTTIIGINQNSTRQAAAIEITSGRSLALSLGNSGSNNTLGALQLNGAIINGIENVIIRNNSNSAFTLQDLQGSSNSTLGLVLANTTDNIINIDGTGGVNISSIISGSSRTLTKAGSGSGVLTLSGANTYTGLTTINSGTLRLNRSGGTTIPVTNNVTISGGTLQVSTNQTVNNLILSSGTLTVDASTTLTINGTFTGGGTIINNGTIVLVGPSTFPGATTTITTMNNLQINKAAGVSLDQSLVIGGTLTLTSGALSIGSNTLTLNGGVSGAGTLSGSSTSNLVIGGTAGTLNFTSGSQILKDLTLNTSATATLGTALEITAGAAPATNGTVIINSGATLASAGNLTLKSNEFGTARVGTSAGTITGNVTVERFIKLRTPGTGTGTGDNGRAYRLLAPTVNTAGSIRANWMEGGLNTCIGYPLCNDNPKPNYGTQITGAGGNGGGFDVTNSNAPSLYNTINGVTPTYNPITSTSGTLNALTGYFLYLRGDRSMNMTVPLGDNMPTSSTTLRTTGTLLFGTRTEADFTAMDATASALNLVTNPYASPIDWTAIRDDAGTTHLATSYTLWDPNIGTRGGFVAVNTSGTQSPSGTGSTATVNIQPGQAFFVQSTGTGTPTLAIKEAHKVSGNNNGVFLVPQESFGVSLFYTESNNYRRLADGTVAVFDNNYSKAIDENDASEINNWDENIAIARETKHLAIDSRPVILTKDTLPLFMNNMKQQAYEFEFTPTRFTNIGLKAELIDNFLNTRTLLSVVNPTVVSFTVTADAASKATDRFKVVFGQFGGLAVDVLTIKAQAKQNGVHVDWTSKTETDMAGYDVERATYGNNFVKLNTTAAIGNSPTPVNYNWFDANPYMGTNFYRVKAYDKAGNIKYSDIVKVTFGKGEPGIAVYPNPMEGNTFKMDMNNLVKGSYLLSLYNSSGQLVYTEEVKHDGSQATRTINLKNGIAKGSYQLQLSSDNGFKTTQTIFKN